MRDIDNRRREQVMSTAERELAERILGYYKSSWEDKERRGLFDLWEKVESYWEGNPRPARSENDPNSNVNFIHAGVEGQVALLVEQPIKINVKPVTPSEVSYAGQVKIMLDWIKDKNKMRRKIDMHERRREKFGTGIFRVLYDPDAIEGFGLPIIDTCNPAYVFCDPGVSDIYKIQQGEFIIETLQKPISFAREQFGDEKAGLIVSGYDPLDNYIFAENEDNDGAYLHIMAWIRTNGKLRLVQMSGCGVILQDSFELTDGESFYPSNRYPYFFTPLYIREGTVWAKGDAELLLSLQDLVDDLDDQIRINARLSGNPQRLVDISANIDLDKWTNESGLIIPTSNIDGVKYLTPPDMPSYPLERRNDALKYEREMVSRFSDQMLGKHALGVSTASEASALISQGGVVIRHKKALLQETLSEMFDYILLLIKEYYTDGKIFRVNNGESDAFEMICGRELKSIPNLVTLDNLDDEIALLEGNESRYIAKGSKDSMFDIRVEIGSDMERE
ncbi:MAG: hypothetical protein LBM38_06520 [Clostridiales bacterium]|jgi:hypothetical protein|nr:hypothetical protein [Clostridiales bacterium]